MNSWVVVGNGPSAPLHADAIDAHDRVIRVNAFQPGQAGNRWDVWASGFYGMVCELAKSRGLWQYAKTPVEVWTLGDGVPASVAARLRTDVTTRQLAGEYRQWLAHHLSARPTAGFLTVAMALMQAPTALTLVGFDAVAPEAPGWGHWWGGGWNTDRTLEVHDLPAEKAALKDWAHTRIFCGREFPVTEPCWLRLGDE